LNAQVLGISVDHIPCIKAWADSLGGIHYPLLSDFWPHGRISEMYGVLRPEGYSERAVFVIDRQGILRYYEILPIDQAPDNEALRKVLRDIEPQTIMEQADAEHEEPAPPPRGGIIMYCTPWCPDCRKGREWLKARGLDFTEVNVIENPDADAQLRIWGNGYRITPTFDIDGVIVLDFKEQELLEALRRRLKP